MRRFANPRRFLRVADALSPWLAAGCVGLLALGLYGALIVAPPDYQQGDAARIMYVHVPAAWMALLGYLMVAVASAAFLIWRHPLADLAARAVAPSGAAFTALCLATGAIWGKPMWGTWWVWDARLTSVLVLLLLYIGYLILANAFDSPARGARPAAILALAGVVNLPVIKFSVEWWNTLHQPASLLRRGGLAIPLEMLWPLLTLAVAYGLLFALAIIARLRGELAAAKRRALILAQGGELP